MCEIDFVFCRRNILNAIKDSRKTHETDSIDSFNDIMEYDEWIPTKLKGISYCAFVRQGNQKEWDIVWDKYTKTSSVNMKRHILHALGCSRQIWILKVTIFFQHV